MAETPKFYIVRNIVYYSLRIINNIYNKRAVWARSPDEGCVNRVYRAAYQIILGEEVLRQYLKNIGINY